MFKLKLSSDQIPRLLSLLSLRAASFIIILNETRSSVVYARPTTYAPISNFSSFRSFLFFVFYTSKRRAAPLTSLRFFFFLFAYRSIEIKRGDGERRGRPLSRERSREVGNRIIRNSGHDLKSTHRYRSLSIATPPLEGSSTGSWKHGDSSEILWR